MTSSLPAAIFFDHDGTLVDTEPLWAQSKSDLAVQFGKTWTEEDTLACLGRPMTDTLIRLQELGIPLSKPELLARLTTDAREIISQTEVPFLPGISDLLEELAQARIPTAIVTNATAEIANMTAGRAPEGLIRTVIGNEDVTDPKPNPQPYLMAAQRLGVEPEDSVAVEDSPSGVASAMAAGMKTIVVPGMQPVGPDQGSIHLNHEDLTLEALRGLFAPRPA
ncbi:HAD family hydrolase [Rothia uropygioeca]|uniref:HAD family hydrolase n=1 Tax=Kocuria sp. 257 TaxID=2021970 RepID=UPI001875EAAD|nr:HAD family phosphatase [Kocuria sp. 257]